MDGYLSKPAGMLELLNTIERWLSPGLRQGSANDTIAAAVTPTPAETAIDDTVDPTVLETISGDDRELAREILIDFRNSNDLDAGRIEQAISDSDSASLTHAAHRIKGEPACRCPPVRPGLRASGASGPLRRMGEIFAGLEKFREEKEILHDYIDRL